MSRHHDEIYLHHIQQAISKTMEWAQVSREAFMNDDFLQSAVIRQLEIAGEAAGRLSEEFRQAHPAFGAKEMKALRNVLIHGYADVDLDTIWAIIHHDLPHMKHVLDQLDRNREPESGD